MYKHCIGLILQISFVLATSDSLLAQNLVIPSVVCPCEYRFNPVCGSDDITYINECVLQCTSDLTENNGNITKVRDGECSSCICQSVNLPVCTLEGLTYPNECVLSCDNIKRIQKKKPIINLAYRTTCLGSSVGCTDTAAPVCGSDDVLYRNRCVLDTASANSQDMGLKKIEFKNNGACLDSCLCPVDKQPACGTDGYIYWNPCYLACQMNKCDSSTREVIGFADASFCESCVCKTEYDPVCGSDGNTYENICRLNCESKRQGDKTLVTVSKGKCANCSCTDVSKPVCGTNYKTYQNECFLRCESELDGGSIGVFFYGECHPPSCVCGCPSEYQPMCGSDGQTYWNLCMLNCSSKCNEGSDKIFLRKIGSCDL